MKRATWFKLIALSLPLLSLAAAELLVRGLYERELFAERYRTAYLLDQICELDELLFRRLRPGAVGNFSLAYEGDDVSVSINRHGFRGADFEEQKVEGVFRILCLGDSNTFGWRIREDEVYPRMLAERLAAAYPGRPFEVLNLGVPGYTAYQGAVLMRELVPRLQPDLIVVAYGFNDFIAQPASVDELAAAHREYFAANSSLGRAVNRVCGESALYRYLRLQLGYAPYDRMPKVGDGEPKWSVGPERYRELISAMIQGARALGSELILVNADLPNARALRELAPLARDEGLPLIDLRGLLLERVGGGVAVDAPELPDDLPPAAEQGRCRLRFRVYLPRRPAEVSLLGDRLSPGGFAGQRVSMHDDGTRGDQRAGDGVYSCLVELLPVAGLSFAFHAKAQPPNDLRSFDNHVFLSLDLPAVPALNTAVYLPGNPMARFCVPLDPIHPDIAGLRIWVDALMVELAANERVRAFVR